MPNGIKDFKGPRADRFPKLPSLNNGPASYDVDQVTTLSRLMAIKPSSILGVCVTHVERFPELKQETPGPDNYEQKTFVHLLDSHISSKREVLNSIEKKSFMDKKIMREMNPGPGTYDVNFAIGRHVGNDNRFALLKSDRLKNRDIDNKRQLTELRTMLNTPDIFTDKRACRRMAHLALYFPS
ncbi:hypothetical protein BDR26DRAFT_874499 [Obelidium mucronatum]|nr:hypothetical protein BDR26DRAFT_874499 [Obelidium mucronatum]